MDLHKKSFVTMTYEEVESTGDVDTVITHRVRQDGEDWNVMLQAYINFLRGIGYVIPEEEDRV